MSGFTTGSLPASALRWELTGAGLDHFGRGGQANRYDTGPPGLGELLARVDACGICFSDIKILNLGGEHPRLRGRDLAREPVYMGHEVSLTIVAVGADVRAPFRPGDRAIVQADVYYRGQGMAMGYRLPGGFSQYVTIGREILEGDEGCYLLPVPGHLGYSEAALCEPWACVEASYQYRPRRGLHDEGTLLLFLADEISLPLQWPGGGARPRSVTVVRAAALPAGLPHLDAYPADWPSPTTIADDDRDSFVGRMTADKTRFDDVVIAGSPSPAEIESLVPLVARGGTLNLVDTAVTAPVRVDVGRVHYEDVAIIGSYGPEVGRAYAESRGAELVSGGIAWFIGAGGPMGQMHLQRALSLPKPPRKIVATQNTGPRHRDLLERFSEPAKERGIALVVLNPKEMPEAALYDRLWKETRSDGFDDIVCLVPSVATIERTPEFAATGGGVNLFAGVPVGTTARLDLRPIVAGRVRYWGTSGSTIADLVSTRDKLAHGELETDGVVAAIAGIHGVRDGLAAVKEGRFLGKTVIYPQLEDLPLLSIAEVADRFPTVVACLTRGRYWNREAEAELLRQVASE